MENYPRANGSTFIIRIWLEWSESGSCWRGQIEHIQSRQKSAFLNLEEMGGFIQNFVAIPAGRNDPVKGGSLPKTFIG
ncbi:MAG: hypothetical protein ACM3PS_08020 [Syntrophothermus sp.]